MDHHHHHDGIRARFARWVADPEAAATFFSCRLRAGCRPEVTKVSPVEWLGGVYLLDFVFVVVWSTVQRQARDTIAGELELELWPRLATC